MYYSYASMSGLDNLRITRRISATILTSSRTGEIDVRKLRMNAIDYAVSIQDWKGPTRRCRNEKGLLRWSV